MVKSVLSVNHQGLRDWMLQRASAVIMAIYCVVFIMFLVSHPTLDFAEWHRLSTDLWFKIATILFVASVLLHAWVGMWTVFTDYIKAFLLRLILNLIVLLMLITCFIWALLTVWSA